MLATGVGAAPDPAGEWVPGELIIKFKPGVAAAEKAALVQGRRIAEFRFIGAEHWKIGDGDPVKAAAAALTADPRVEYAEPNYLIGSREVPDDPLFSQLWGLHNTGQAVGGTAGIPGADIDAVDAWDIFTGSPSAVVAVIDTGVDYLHPDLAANVWVNPGEIAANGLDDDGNGFIDDVHGWDFANGDNDPLDDNGHGTHCAGTIGGVADNGAGVAGVNWNVGIMALKFQNASGIGATTAAIAAIEYAAMMGVDVMSCSWGNSIPSTALEAAVQAAYAADIFFVAAAGNDGANNDYSPHYPASFEAGNVIAVMATDNRDRRAAESTWSSNYGPTTVDIAAPGVQIWSTARNGAYMYLSGTSMATPHVAGALAMLRGRHPGISVDDGKALLMTIGNDPVPSLAGLCVTGARLNLRKLIADPDTSAPSTITDLTVGAVASNWLMLSWTAPGDNGAIRSYDVRHAASPITDEAGWQAATQAAGEPVPAIPGTPVTMRVGGLFPATTRCFSVRARDDYGNPGNLSNSPSATTLAAPTIAVEPASLTVTTPPGASVARALTITNAGAGVLDFTIPGMVPVDGADGIRAGADGSGGPDRYGYHWTDSDTPGGPAFDWIDISREGIAVTLADDSCEGPFEIGFAFPFYGAEYTTFRIGSNGYVSLSSTLATAANTALPSASAPGNLLALLWDGLTQGDGTCTYHGDGTRLIVQYTDWGNAVAGGPYSMQLRLYPDGIIEYHYLTMTAPASESATIGIQNGDGTDGLTVAHDAAYLHDNLAIRFAYLPHWLSVSPTRGSLAAGASLDVGVVFDATGLCASGLDADVHVLSNDPLHPDVIVPAGIVLTGAQDIAVSPGSLAFGPVSVGRAATLPLEVANRGCADLSVLGLEFDDPGFASAQTLPLVVAVGDVASLAVSFTPGAAGEIAGQMTLRSDDPDSPILTIPLSGAGLDVPRIAVDPASLAGALAVGGTMNRELTIANEGAGDLHFTIPGAEYVPLEARRSAPGADPAVGSGGGGPDAFGYRWKDSDDPYGPDFDWIEIATTGTRIPFSTSEQTLGSFDIGFTFPFYGAGFTQFSACSNGWISFSDGSSFDSQNRALPSSDAPANLVAPFWDDLNFSGGRGSAWYRNDGRRLIIEYMDVPLQSAAGSATFQIHLYPTGRIEFHYQTMTIPLNSATVGLQNGTRTVGLTVVHDADYVHDRLAVRFEDVPHWLAATPSAGTVGAGSSTLVTVSLDAAGLCGNAYQASLHVLSDDPDTPDLSVPVSLAVPVSAVASVSPPNLSFGDVFLSGSAVLGVGVVNAGCDPLLVADLSLDSPFFTIDLPAPFSVAPRDTLIVGVSFVPGAAGVVTGNLTVATNDAAHPTLTVPLSGRGLNPAALTVDPGRIDVSLPAGQRRTAGLHLENNGDGALTYTVPPPVLYDGIVEPGKAAVTGGGAQGAPGAGPRLGRTGRGGPDAFGYTWIDSDDVGGPAFDWIDIGDTGLAALTSGDDANGGPFPIGFAFRYYDDQFTTFRVCSNGWLSFTSPAAAGTNRTLPNELAPRNLLAPFWDDLDLDAIGSGDVLYGNVDGNLIVQWDGVAQPGATAPLAFQVVLKPNGTIIYQYLSVAAAVTGSATIGMQDATGTMGVQVAFNREYLHDNLAIKLLAAPEWALVTPSSGAIPPGGSADLEVAFDATGLGPGEYAGLVRILSNDPLSPEVQVPLTMSVQEEIPGGDDPLPAAVVLLQNVPNPFNPDTLIRFGLPVRDAVELRIFDVRGALVRTVAAGEFEAGYHDTWWQGRADDGTQVPSGVYFYRLRTAAGDITRRLTVIR